MKRAPKPAYQLQGPERVLNAAPELSITKRRELRSLLTYMDGIGEKAFDRTWVALVVDGAVMDSQAGKVDVANLARVLTAVRRRYRRMAKG